jgi:RDD family
MYSGYFAVFEALWNGQTPGKRYAQLRVMKDDGRPINAFDAVARNLLRIVDSLPALYGVGVISVFLSKKNKRLGDFVAGTVVVHEKTVEAARPFLDTQVDASSPSYDVSKLNLHELQLIETFLQRRDSFDPALRGSMAAQIASRIGQTLEVQVYGWPYNERFLEAVHAQYRAAGRYQQEAHVDSSRT